MALPPNRWSTMGWSLAVFGVLLMAIKFGLMATDLAGGGTRSLTFAGPFFVLIGVAILLRQQS